jgi:hypothetical protein
MAVCVCVYIYIYIYMHTHTYIHVACTHTHIFANGRAFFWFWVSTSSYVHDCHLSLSAACNHDFETWMHTFLWTFYQVLAKQKRTLNGEPLWWWSCSACVVLMCAWIHVHLTDIYELFYVFMIMHMSWKLRSKHVTMRGTHLGMLQLFDMPK